MHINNESDLKTAIALLEEREQSQKTEINKQFKSAINSLNPFSKITTAISKVDISEVIGMLLAAAIVTGSGLVSKKILTGSADGYFKNAIGKLVEFVVTGLGEKKTYFSE